jgi:hypothetical protein
MIGLDLEDVDGAVDRETQRAFMNTTDDQVVGGAEGPLRQTQLRAKVDEWDQLAPNVQESSDDGGSVGQSGWKRGPLDLPHQLRSDGVALVVQLESQKQLDAHALPVDITGQ